MNWTSEQLEAQEQKQLAKRLDAQPKQRGGGLRKVLVKNTKIPSKGIVSGRKITKAKKETANAITANVIRCINIQPKCVAYRINNVGIWDEAKQIHRRANTQKGIFDVSATIKGRAAWFEIKAGYDKPSQDQLIFQQEVRRAGGIAEFVNSTDAFLEMFRNILLEI